MEDWNVFSLKGDIKRIIKEIDSEPEGFEQVIKYITKKIAKILAAHEVRKYNESERLN